MEHGNLIRHERKNGSLCAKTRTARFPGGIMRRDSSIGSVGTDCAICGQQDAAGEHVYLVAWR
eukprot:2724220-Pyramimonas_sp.AAC.3